MVLYEPMSLLPIPHARPAVMLFDWHATLADTLDAMYHAVDDVLPMLDRLGLDQRLMEPKDCKTLEDAKLVKYVQTHGRLHPRIKEERKISRTDIFEVLFGPDQEAKRLAHQAFDDCYRNHFGEAQPLEDGIPQMLETLREMGLHTGVITNRNREFMVHELGTIDGNGWSHLFDTIACGDEVHHRKPAPDLILKALERIDVAPDPHCWYVGDSTTDIVAAKEAGVTAIFYNGAKWKDDWLDRIFPGTIRHPHKPDAVIQDFAALQGLVREILGASEAAVEAPS